MKPDDPYEAELRKFEQAVERLFGPSERTARVNALIEVFRRDRQAMEGNRGFTSETVGFFGVKNHGKSYLLGCLLDDMKAREQLRDGIDRATEKVTWVGPNPPRDFDPSVEVHVQTAPRPESGPVWVDVPGFNDPVEAARRAAERARASCRVKVFVVRVDQVEDAIVRQEAAHLDGVVLPVLNRVGGPEEQPAADRLSARLRDILMRQAPSSEILEPLRIGATGVIGSLHQDEAAIRRDLQLRIEEAIKRSRELAGGSARRVALRYQTLRQELGTELADFLKITAAPREEVADALRRLPEGSLARILGSERMQGAAVRLGIRAEFLRRVPEICFPFRSVIGLLCLTSGAWDRLALALSGSVPSLAMTAAQSAKNLKSSGRWARTDNLGRRLESEFRRQVSGNLKRFAFAVGVATDRREGMVSGDVSLRGFDLVEKASLAVFEEEASRAAPKFIVPPLALGAAALWWGMLAGPLAVVYVEFWEAWIRVISAPRDSDWAQFPMPHLGLAATSLFLATLPVFLLGLVGLAWASRGGVVRRCTTRIRDAHQRKISELQESGSFGVTLRDPVLEAADTVTAMVAGEPLRVRPASSP